MKNLNKLMLSLAIFIVTSIVVNILWFDYFTQKNFITFNKILIWATIACVALRAILFIFWNKNGWKLFIKKNIMQDNGKEWNDDRENVWLKWINYRYSQSNLYKSITQTLNSVIFDFTFYLCCLWFGRLIITIYLTIF
jgi:hypothetical protein